MKLADKVVVVTGAGSGIGREVVLEALRRGAALAAVDVNPTTLDETASLAAAGARLSTHVVNIMDREAVEALPAAVTERHGTIDGIINCAGIIQPFVRLKDLDYEAIERVMAVNWSGTLYLTKTFLPLLIARPEGHIVNVSSMGGFLPVPGQTVYGASKAAVKLFTEGLHSECRGTKVHVTIVFPEPSPRTSPPTPASRSPAWARTRRRWRVASRRPTPRRARSWTAWRRTPTASWSAAMRS